MNTSDKLANLQTLLTAEKRLAVAFSGGIDSAFLLKIAHDALGDNCLAVTAVSPLVPGGDLQDAADFCASLGVRHITVSFDALSDPDICRNPPERCYICKKRLFTAMKTAVGKLGFYSFAEGSNADDTSDYRPGMRAVRELGVLSPLLKSGLTKNEIRRTAREIGIPLWHKPSAACLASRIPYGEPITADKLRKIADSEDFIRREILGSDSPLRVRISGEDSARIEVAENDADRLFSRRQEVSHVLHSFGFRYVSLDLDGFRSGSMNEVLGGDLK